MVIHRPGQIIRIQSFEPDLIQILRYQTKPDLTYISELEPNPKIKGIQIYLKYKYISKNISYANTYNNSNDKIIIINLKILAS